MSRRWGDGKTTRVSYLFRDGSLRAAVGSVIRQPAARCAVSLCGLLLCWVVNSLFSSFSLLVFSRLFHETCSQVSELSLNLEVSF